jgi:hypothetical protein
MRNAYKLCQKKKRRYLLEEQDINRIMLKWLLEKVLDWVELRME